MAFLRSPRIRRAIGLLLAWCFVVAAVEAPIADVHDGGATHAEVDRVTGESHAQHGAPVLAALLTLSAAGSGIASSLSSHCDAHSRAAQDSSAHPHSLLMPEGGSLSTQPVQHDCPHCPPADCSHAASCATSGGAAVVVAAVSVATLAPQRVAVVAHREPSIPDRGEPPTPPPQVAS